MIYLFHTLKKIKSTECCHWKVVLSISALVLKLHLKEFIWLICSRCITFHQLGHIHTFSSVWSSVFDFHQLLWEICAASAANCTCVQQLFNQKVFFFLLSETSSFKRAAAAAWCLCRGFVLAHRNDPTSLEIPPPPVPRCCQPTITGHIRICVRSVRVCVWDTDTTVTYRSCGVNIS